MRRNEDEKLNNEDEYDEEGELRNLKSLRGWIRKRCLQGWNRYGRILEDEREKWREKGYGEGRGDIREELRMWFLSWPIVLSMVCCLLLSYSTDMTPWSSLSTSPAVVSDHTILYFICQHKVINSFFANPWFLWGRNIDFLCSPSIMTNRFDLIERTSIKI